MDIFWVRKCAGLSSYVVRLEGSEGVACVPRVI